MQYINNLFDSVVEQYCGEEPQSRLGRLIQQKMSGLFFRDSAVFILNLLIICGVIPCGKIIEGKTNYLFWF